MPACGGVPDVLRITVFSISTSSPEHSEIPCRWFLSHRQLRIVTPFEPPMTMPSPPDSTKRMFSTRTSRLSTMRSVYRHSLRAYGGFW